MRAIFIVALVTVKKQKAESFFFHHQTTFQQVTKASGTLGMLVGEGIQRGAPPSGTKARFRYVSLSSFKTVTGGRDLLVGGLALLGLNHALNLYTKNTPW